MIDEFKLTQEEISDIVGKSRSTVANILRLLNLHPFVQDMLKKGKITEGHARVLLRIADDLGEEGNKKFMNLLISSITLFSQPLRTKLLREL